MEGDEDPLYCGCEWCGIFHVFCGLGIGVLYSNRFMNWVKPVVIGSVWWLGCISVVVLKSWKIFTFIKY